MTNESAPSPLYVVERVPALPKEIRWRVVDTIIEPSFRDGSPVRVYRDSYLKHFGSLAEAQRHADFMNRAKENRDDPGAWAAP